MQMLKKRSSMKKGHDNYLCPYPLITMGQKTFSFTAEGIVKSDNLKCWVAGAIVSSTKRLMVQVLF